MEALKLISKTQDVVGERLSDAKLQEFATKINKRLDRIATEVIAIGLLFLEAKAAAGHGQFERLFKDYDGAEGPVKEPIPMTHRHATSYMRIANHPLLSSKKVTPLLPHSINTLLVLAKEKDVKKVEAGFEKQVIRPSMSPAEARDFLRKKPKRQTDLARAKAAIKKALLHLFERFPPLRSFIVDTVATLIEEYPNEDVEETEETEREDDTEEDEA